MKFLLLPLCSVLYLNTALAQFNRSFFKQKEDSLIILSARIINDAALKGRMDADSAFTKVLVRTLKQPNSFQYKFDNLRTWSLVYPPDSSFRIFTWQMAVSDNMVRQRGAVQIKTNDGSLNLIPLIDKSDLIVNSGDTVTSAKAWIGAVYYKILQNGSGHEKVYTLLGLDANNFRSDKKIMEVMQIKNGQPVFGGNFFNVPKLPGSPNYNARRIIIEYRKDAGARLMFDEDENMVLIEHLISETNEPNKKYTLVPDGDFTGFKWANGKWNFVEKVFTTVPEATAPVPKPLNETKGLDRDNR